MTFTLRQKPCPANARLVCILDEVVGTEEHNELLTNIHMPYRVLYHIVPVNGVMRIKVAIYDLEA